MLGLAAPSHNSLRSLRSLRSDRCDESVVDARCARGRKPCASRRLRGALQPARARLCGDGCGGRCEDQNRCLAAGGVRWGRFLGRREGEQGHKRSGGPLVPCERPGLLARRGLQGQGRVGARSALRQLTRRDCSNGANAVSAVSFAARPRTEHRSGVGAQRRPPQHEPPPGTACREATEAAGRRTAAMGHEQSGLADGLIQFKVSCGPAPRPGAAASTSGLHARPALRSG